MVYQYFGNSLLTLVWYMIQPSNIRLPKFLEYLVNDFLANQIARKFNVMSVNTLTGSTNTRVLHIYLISPH